MSLSRLALYSLILSLYLVIQAHSQNVTFPQSILTQMATRQMRYHHYLWHQIRDNWNQFSNTTQQAFQAIGWLPPNPSKDSSGNRIKTNYAGEDFLYMHRDMIATVNQIITQNKEAYGKIQGWTTIPAPGDLTYPVPASFSKVADSYRTDDYYTTRIKPAEDKLKDPAKLKKMTLNDLGVEIEGGIHNAMHMRWAAANSYGYRSGGSVSSGVPNISKTWDDMRYDWLADSYASHVNPIFWKLHGWIDDRIEDWRKANNLTAITWKGTWTGGPMSSLASVMKKTLGHNMQGKAADPEAVGDLLEKTLEIFMNSGVPESRLDDVVWPEDIQSIKPRNCRKSSKVM